MVISSREIRSRARAALKDKWGVSLALSFVAGVLGAESFILPVPAFSFSAQTAQFGSGRLFSFFPLRQFLSVKFLPVILVVVCCLCVVRLFAGSAARLGGSLYYIRLLRAETPGFSTLFQRFSIFGRAVGLRLYTLLFIFLWSLALAVPGIVAAFRYAMAPYLMAEHPEMGIREAVNVSKKIMLGHKKELLMLYLSFFGWALLAVLSCGVGFLWLGPYVQAAVAEFYLEVSYQRADASGALRPRGKKIKRH